MTQRFAGRTVLVTGSSRGIGLRLATAFAAEGADVVLNARTADATGEARARLEHELADADGTGRILESVFDVADDEGVRNAIDALATTTGAVDILVNNAGIHRRAPLVDLAAEDWRAVLDTNFTGPFLVSRSVAPAMIAAGAGVILNICSVQSALARPSTAAYAASKAGLAGLTRAMCAEWASSGLRVNGLAPGYVDTELNEPLVSDPVMSAWVLGRTPAARWGHVDDITGPALWLCSDEAAFVNGQVVYADGGMTAVV